MGLSTEGCRYTDKFFAGQKVLGYEDPPPGKPFTKTRVWVQCPCGKEHGQRLQKLKEKQLNKLKKYCSYDCPVLQDKYKERGRALRQIAELKKQGKKELVSDFKFQNCHWCGRQPTKFRPSVLGKASARHGWTIANTLPECRWCNTARGELSPKEFVEMFRNIILRHGEHEPLAFPTVRYRKSREAMLALSPAPPS